MKLDVDRQAYEPRIAVYGAALHQQEPDVAVAVGKDGYLKVPSCLRFRLIMESKMYLVICITILWRILTNNWTGRMHEPLNRFMGNR